MPTYSYACKDCGHAFDINQSFSDDSLTVCPECGGALRKKFGSVGVVFKGSGFYKTDSRDSPKKSDSASGTTSGDSAKPAEAGKKATESSSAPAKSESKPAAAKSPGGSAA